MVSGQEGNWARRTRREIAARVARDIPEGWYVNLGIGIPTMVADEMPLDREVVFHSENGVLGMVPLAEGEEPSPWLVNAGKQNVGLRTGGSYVHHADSFSIIRGGHLDLCVMGSFQVAENGDFANWATNPHDSGVGGAMDLAAGAKRIWITMEHTSKSGAHKLMRACSYPLTAAGVVSRVYTDLAVLDVTPQGFECVEMVPGLDLHRLQDLSGAPLTMASGQRAGLATA